MDGARWFSAVTGSLSGVWARIVARHQAQQGLGSLEEYQREVGRLRGELERVRAKREKEKAEFDEMTARLENLDNSAVKSLVNPSQK